jgi:hypothetical protein
MARVAKKRMNQTWRDAIAEQGGPAAGAILRAFDDACAGGAPEHVAAYRALDAHGRLAEVDLPGDPSPTLAAAETAQIAPEQVAPEDGRG